MRPFSSVVKAWLVPAVTGTECEEDGYGLLKQRSPRDARACGSAKAPSVRDRAAHFAQEGPAICDGDHEILVREPLEIIDALLRLAEIAATLIDFGALALAWAIPNNARLLRGGPEA